MFSQKDTQRFLESLTYSPYLSRLHQQFPDLLARCEQQGVTGVYHEILQDLPSFELILPEHGQQDLMHHLRRSKARLALLTAIADITHIWTLEEVTHALSEFAARAVHIAVDALLIAAHHRGDIVLQQPENPSQRSGFIVIAMGKLGADELNYSSDIDLMLFFERGKLAYQGRHNEQHFMNKLAHDLVHIMQERTPDGYVFRTDLRLRPDPASTPPAISTEAAYYYYESVGQNWERAAMIKARAIAGDIAAGELFLKNLLPFMWRRSLDFAAINDIHSIKRQMDSRQNKELKLAGHHIKLGIGGIREIEFFVQIHQLIWGGRQPNLRSRSTCEMLEQLAEHKLATPETTTTLKNAYVFLRTLEHRLQMVDDEQTHELPKQEDALLKIAGFMGYQTLPTFEHALMSHLRAVHSIYAASFKSADELGDKGNLVFTGVAHDPDTLSTLKDLGFSTPETISEIIMGWHHGSKRATRTKRARELLTELMPTLLKRLSETANPDLAFLKFNDFLTHLPAGVQLFSLFNANPHLLGLIADIMGSAPMLAEHLSKSPSLLDAVLYADFYEPLPTPEQLAKQWEETAPLTHDFADTMNALRRFRNEKQFQAGVHLLKRMISAEHAGKFLAALADLMIQRSLAAVEKEFARQYGHLESGQFAIVGLGKLGSEEMTFHSDIDLIFVYHASDDVISGGEKGLSASSYYNRLAQRLINALSTMEREGRLYEVDTRLRPSGTQGLLAVSMSGLQQYFEEQAWTFEYMAFTKARPVAGDSQLRQDLDFFIQSQLAKPRDPEKLRADVADMRQRIGKAHTQNDPWNIKYVRGGLIDIDFIAQYLLLLYAPAIKDNHYPGSAKDIIHWLKKHEKIHADIADNLAHAEHFLGQIFNMLRLCANPEQDIEQAPPGMKKLLARSVEIDDFSALKEALITVEHDVFRHYNSYLHPEGNSI